MNLKKAVILCGGYGTRMRPFTNRIPKELLPIIQYPVIDFVIKECIRAGITDVCFVINEKKDILQEYIRNSINDLNISFAMQKEEKGTASAILYAKKFLADSDFAVLFPDEISFNKNGPICEIYSAFQNENSTVLGCKKVNRKDIGKYGIIVTDNSIVKKIVEKPQENISSRLALCGRFIFKNDILSYLRDIPLHNGEKYLTDALNLYAKEKKTVATCLKNKTYDTGNPVDYHKAIEVFYKKFLKKGENIYK